jgi:cell division control protein 42
MCFFVYVDFKGQENYDRLRPLSYVQTDVFLLCFDVNNPTSLDHVRTKWLPEVRRHAPATPALVVGTKIDMRTSASVSREIGEATTNELGVAAYLECSALTREGISSAFQTAIRVALSPQGNRHRRHCTLA